MKNMRSRRTQPNQLNKLAFLFHKYRIYEHDAEKSGKAYETREIGKAMAEKIAKKVKLNLDV